MKLTKYVRARSLIATLTVSAGFALSALIAAGSVATAQELDWATGVKRAAIGSGSFDPLGIATDGPGNSY